LRSVSGKNIVTPAHAVVETGHDAVRSVLPRKLAVLSMTTPDCGVKEVD